MAFEEFPDLPPASAAAPAATSTASSILTCRKPRSRASESSILSETRLEDDDGDDDDDSTGKWRKGTRLKRSPSLPTMTKLRRTARKASALSASVRSRYLEAAAQQEQLLFLLYTTRHRSRRRVSWLTDPLALWRIFWRWLGIVLLLLNSTLLLRAAWHEHRCDMDPLCVQPLCDVRPSTPRERQQQWKLCAPALLAARSGSAVQIFSVAELLLGLRTAAAADLASHGYRRGYRSALFALDVVLTLDALDALLLTLGSVGGGEGEAAEPTPPRAGSSDRGRDSSRSGVITSRNDQSSRGRGARGSGARGSGAHDAQGSDATAIATRKPKWKWAWWEEVESAHIRPALEPLHRWWEDRVEVPTRLWWGMHVEEPTRLWWSERVEEPTRLWWSERVEGPATRWWEDMERLHVRPITENLNKWWSEVGDMQQRWLLDVQRRWRETRLVRTVVGYQRLVELPKPPRLVEWLLDDKLLPAYFGEGWEKVQNQVDALPAIGDFILAATMLQAFAASFLRSLKALILLASAAKAVRVRRRLRRERAANRISTAWRRHGRQLRAQRDLARLRWQQAVACIASDG